MSAVKAVSRADVARVGESVRTLLQDVQNDSIVERLRDALLSDLERLCELAKQHGVDEVRSAAQILRLPVTWAGRDSRVDPHFGGSYVGFGLGEGWLDLGFLADPVVEALKKRLAEHVMVAEQIDPHEYGTRSGPIIHRGTLFDTTLGCFEVGRTYCWFVTRRVD